MVGWEPTRRAGLRRLETFAPLAGPQYAQGRNIDEGWERGADDGPTQRSSVSGLSPWIQRRLVLESEVVRAAVDRHGPVAAEKFTQEVLWRTYWKGWMQMRPSVWSAYVRDRAHDVQRVEDDRRLAPVHRRACDAETGIDGFDHWAHELQETGYLHNHARMWFASIWIFTLGLPWTLGADLFERHLLDADAASNTLSWRWVAGLHTRGKHYVARASNIRSFTQGRFDPAGQLVEDPEALREDEDHPREDVADFDPIQPGPRSGLLVTPEDLALEVSELRSVPFTTVAGGLPSSPTASRPSRVRRFDQGALEDGLRRAARAVGVPAHRLIDGHGFAEAVARWAKDAALDRVVAVAPHVGPFADAFVAVAAALRAEGVAVALHRRDWDRTLFPRASAGYFTFKKAIPNLLREL